MDKFKLIFIGKWIMIGLLIAFNFLSYLVNGTLINIMLAILIFVYSAYLFFKALSPKLLHFGIKLYLFSFYLFAVISLLMGMRSFVTGNITSMLMSLFLIGGDIALILYTIHKQSELKDN